MPLAKVLPVTQAEVIAEFRGVNGQLADPTRVECEITDPNDVEILYVYPNDPEVTKLAVGRFQITVLCSIPGRYWVRWQGADGGPIVASEDYILALPRQT